MKILGVRWSRAVTAMALGVAGILPAPVVGLQAPALSTCTKGDTAPACTAIRGDRAEGWKAQSRAEVFAQHGMVVSSQPLATQAGLQVLKQGGNAIDAAVAAAAVLSVVEPMNVGIAGDLFAIVYIAKDRKLYALNANVIAPHKRPYNTLSAGFVMRGDRPLMSLLLMGGDMQAQGHAQALVNLFDLGANLQMATDMARFRHSQVSNSLVLEQGLYDLVGKELAAMGHVLGLPSSAGVGGFQAIAVQHPNGKGGARVYRAGSDHRKDGQAAGY